jgi:hypothetical protein
MGSQKYDKNNSEKMGIKMKTIKNETNLSILLIYTMVYYAKSDYLVQNYRKSNTKHKMYDAILKHRTTGKKITVPFGDSRYNNYKDDTGLNLYPALITGDGERRRLYRIRHSNDVRDNFYSPGYFSMEILW